MTKAFLHVQGLDFVADGEKIVFRGFGVGNFLNLEHFMIGLPGNESQIRQAICDVYGEENARRFWSKYQACYLGEADFQFMQSIGVNVIRIPFNYHIFESDQMPYQYNRDGFAPIDRVLALCEKYRIYAILDLHAAPGGQNPDWHCDNPIGENLFWAQADYRKRVISLWRFIAEHYRENPWVGAYDLMNEPVCAGYYSPEMVPEFFNELRKNVREVDPNHLIFLEGDTYSRDFSQYKLCTDSNVAYTFHYYAFFEKDVLAGPGQMEKTEEAIFRGITLDYIREKLQRPVWCGETGIPMNQGEVERYESLLRDTLKIYEKHGISWTLWCFKDARSMGTVMPQKDAPWMKFSERAVGNWDFWKNFNDWSEVDRLSEKFGTELSPELRRKIHFRNQASHQLLLAERFRRLLREIPFEEFITYPESFLFERCETWSALVEMVKEFTK